ncbi:hypothetical protein MFIFM68171_06266 [Madurella fahalii]|uniref:SIR2-like domain-containing protein n=1 Tax=Madurella fahalii TaxID=1157608 RepID=A0ABQ0GE72_9PEZI
MARLVDSPKPPPPTSWEKWRRSLNKKLGRPATPDVGILAGMFMALRDAVSLALASPLDSVAVAHPPIPGLAAYDVADALEYAGLRSWLTSETAGAGLYPARLTEAHAVFAAEGQGLCNNYKDLFECWDEQERMVHHTVLLVGFTRVDLRAEVAPLRAPFHWDQSVLEMFVDLGAGLDGMDDFESEVAFWARVHDRLTAVARRTRLTRVMLVGENVTDPKFLSVLKDALAGSRYAVGSGEIQGEERVLVVPERDRMVDPMFASARGAAQYARWRQEAPFGCREQRRCDEDREREREREREMTQKEQGSQQIGAGAAELK